MRHPHPSQRGLLGAPQRPRVFVYDMPSKYATRMIQYRVVKVQHLTTHLQTSCTEPACMEGLEKLRRSSYRQDLPQGRGRQLLSPVPICKLQSHAVRHTTRRQNAGAPSASCGLLGALSPGTIQSSAAADQAQGLGSGQKECCQLRSDACTAQSACFWRDYGVGNVTELPVWTYAIESLLHEWLLQSPHRTLDPDEADFFYVPVYTSCFMHPVWGWADHPWWYGPEGARWARVPLADAAGTLHAFSSSVRQLPGRLAPPGRLLAGLA